MNTILLDCKQIEKHYKLGDEQIPVFSGLSCEINQGEFLAIMGPSGSGKTTLLNLLAGIDRVDSGEIWYNGTRIDNSGERNLSAWRTNNVAIIFQYYNLLTMLTAEQNIELPLLLKSLSPTQRKKKVDAALDLVGLTNRRMHKPNALSGGQQQRVAIARAIVSDVPLLLCDEPTGNLDTANSNEILEILRLLNDEFKRTIVLATHDDRARNYALTVKNLEHGKLAAVTYEELTDLA